MKRVFLVGIICLVVVVVLSVGRGFAEVGEDRESPAQSGTSGGAMVMKADGGMEMAHGFPHPFFNHMGIPDMPGMLSVRATGYRQGRSGEESRSDYGFHLEAGLYDRVGLHVRSNAINQNPRTDIMLMYAVARDAEAESGVSVFGGALVPSGTIPEGQDDVVGAFGVAARKVLGDFAIFDGNVHYMPEMGMVEAGLSGVFKATDSFFPIVELEAELSSDETVLYLLPALKFKLKPELFLGVGSQVALTSDREFDTRALLQVDAAW
ncbi:MAG TPA: hypothetical protein ENJ04_11115 [Nitrospirae bacterium]|nr:hypothetical protein [Nitrospirota bacterium]